MKTYKMTINGQKYEAKVLKYDGSSAKVNVNGSDFVIELENENATVAPKLIRSEKIAPVEVFSAPQPVANTDSGTIVTPIPGIVIDVKVKEGDIVGKEDIIIILEAMKMESEITTHLAGKVKKIMVSKGQSIQEGQAIVEIGE